jgi:hypothetical protein
MSEQELINSIGTMFVNNWSYFLGGFITFLTCCMVISWKVASGFHLREKRILQTELAHQKERFSQYESIVEQRISLLQSEAEALSRKAGKVEDLILYQRSDELVEHKSQDTAEKPMFMRVPAKESDRIKSFIEKTDLINSILKSIGGVI